MTTEAHPIFAQPSEEVRLTARQRIPSTADGILEAVERYRISFELACMFMETVDDYVAQIRWEYVVSDDDLLIGAARFARLLHLTRSKEWDTWNNNRKNLEFCAALVGEPRARWGDGVNRASIILRAVSLVETCGYDVAALCVEEHYPE